MPKTSNKKMRICPKCGEDMIEEKNFYKKKNGEYFDLCRKCLTMHVDNFDESTYLWIIEEANFPYIKHVWNKHRERALVKNKKLTGMSVLGRYFGSMRLSNWAPYEWRDTSELNNKFKDKLEDAETIKPMSAEHEEKLRLQLENGEITEAQYRTLTSKADIEELELKKKQAEESRKIESAILLNNNTAQDTIQELPEQDIMAITGEDEENPFLESDFISEDELIDLGAELTKEDKVYLAMKWGRFYRPSEWVMLEQDYDNYMQSFDIQDQDTKNSLLQLCKVNLKANQALDAGDVDVFQKLAKAQTELRKTSKFTASQKKEEDVDFIDSIAELVYYCEENGGAIPQYKLDVPQDYVDVEMKDTQDFIRTLIYEDPTLANSIDNYIKKRSIAEDMGENQEKALMEGKDGISISDDEYMDYVDDINEQIIKDMGVYDNESRNTSETE